VTDPAKKPDPEDEEHSLEQLLARLRAELAAATLPVPPDDAPAPPRPWSEPNDGEA
jgi:hypothetical protein